MTVDGLTNLQHREKDNLFLSLSRCVRNFMGESPVFFTKNLPKTDWSENPNFLAISLISIVHLTTYAGTEQFADAVTVCPVMCFTMRER